MVRLPHIKEYYKFSSLAEALSALKEHKGSAIPIAGATSFVFNRPSARITTLIDLTALGLNHIKQTKRLVRLGSMLTLNELAESDNTATMFNGVLQSAARATALFPTRNLITLGGNCVSIFSWSIFPVVLWALDASFIINSASSGRKKLPADDLFSAHPKKVLANYEIISEIQVPVIQNGKNQCYYHFKKFSRTATEFSWVTLATRFILNHNNHTICDARIVAGALSPMPQRLYQTEKILVGNPLTQNLVDKAISVLESEAKIAKDLRCSVEYKRRIASVLFREILDEIISRGRKKQK